MPCGRIFHVLFWSAIVLGSVLPQSGLAQTAEEVRPAPLPPGIPVIPGPKDRDTALLLTQKNEAAFEDILIAPLVSWIRDGKFALRVVRSLDYPWTLDPAWEDASRRNPFQYELNEDHTLKFKGEEAPEPGLPFGSADDINEESDPVRKAYRILWNIAYAEAAARDAYYHVDMAWVGTQSLLRSASGVLYRKSFFAPASDEDKKETPKEFSGPQDVFRETVLRLFSPPVVAGFTQFSLRYRGPQEDVLWLYSPVLKLIRPLLESNRSDALLGGNLTFDDLFVWSNKIPSVQAKVVDQKVILVPFPALTYYRPEVQSFTDQNAVDLDSPASSELPPAQTAKPDMVYTVKGAQKRSDGLNSVVLWNHQSRQLPQLAPWVPTTVAFVPHRVWILEIDTADPYYASGREILIVDQELMLPIYKLVYDRIGEYRKTIVGSWALARSKDGKTVFPFSAFVMAVDQASQSVTTLSTRDVQTFQGKPFKAAVQVQNWFDPAKYPGGKKQGEKGEKPAPTSTPSPAETEGYSND
jgi:hypothetical protein